MSVCNNPVQDITQDIYLRGVILMFRKSMKAIVISAALAGCIAMAAPAQAELSKDDVNKLIHDYIMEHPQLILDSVNEYQKRSIAEKQAESLQRNHDELFNNEKSPVLGNPKGDVTIIEFFDYNCHYCKDVFASLVDLTNEDKNLKVIFKDFPILGATSELAAKWALAAQRQNKYFEFHKKMMEHKGPLKNGDIEDAAKDIGLDLAAARLFVDGTDSLLQIERNRSLAQQMSFNGTPSFVVNDESFSGVPSTEELKNKIAEKRKQATAKKGDGDGKKDDGMGGKP